MKLKERLTDFVIKNNLNSCHSSHNSKTSAIVSELSSMIDSLVMMEQKNLLDS